MTPLSEYLTVAFILFAIGLVGLFTRRTIIMMLLSIEILFNAVNLTFVVFSQSTGKIDGQIATLFTMAIAAGEVAVGLAIAILLFRTQKSIDVTDFTSLKD